MSNAKSFLSKYRKVNQHMKLSPNTTHLVVQRSTVHITAMDDLSSITQLCRPLITPTRVTTP